MQAHTVDQSTTYPSPATAVEDAELNVTLEAEQPLPFDTFDVNNQLFEDTGNSFVDTATGGTDSFWPLSTAWQWTHEDLYLHDRSVFAPVEETTASMAIDHLPQNQYLYDIDMDCVQTTSHNLPNSEGSRKSPSRDHPQRLHDLVSEMVRQAVRKDKNIDWAEWSRQLSQIVDLPPCQSIATVDATFLDILINQYITHFHPLWPLIPADFSVSSGGHPLQLLTLTSIGALYCGANAAKYGSLMHCGLRNALLEYKTSDQQEDEALDIGRAMLLTQVAALYFEQEGAFSAAEQLGARLHAHAHRMRLFALKAASRPSQSQTPIEHDITLAEGRSMLAYGMLRAETFMSVLFNRKPMLSYEEIDLPLPSPRDRRLAPTAVHMISDSSKYRGSGLLFSDLVRIALDAEEPLPTLRPVDLELLVFGLQNDVWRFSHDPEMFVRLIQERTPQNDPRKKHAWPNLPSADLLDHTRRKMCKLVSDYNGLHAALVKWDGAMRQSQLLYPVEDSRSAYLSGLVLLNLSFLRLCAPVDAILQVAYQNHSLPSIDTTANEQVAVWASTSKVQDAVLYSRTIWRLLSAETVRRGRQEAKYNILALIALHIAAAVTWAIAGSNTQQDICFLEHTDAPELMLQRTNTKSLMLKFADLYPQITVSWGMQSSFARIVRKLADQPLPIP